MKGLAFGTEKPCVGVSSVEALAWGMRMAEGIVCPLINARRTQYYSALFRVHSGEVTRLTEDDVILDADLPGILTAYDEPVYLCGDGYEAAWRADLHPQLCATPPEYRLPNAYAAVHQYWVVTSVWNRAISRIINPLLGGQIAFCVDRYSESSTMEQIDLKAAKAVMDNIYKIL